MCIWPWTPNSGQKEFITLPQHGRHPEVKEFLALPLQLQMPSREVKGHLGMSRNLAKEPLIRGGFRRTEMGDRPRRDRRLASEREKLTRHRASATSSSGKGAGGGKGGGKGKSKDQSARVQHVPVVRKGNTEVGGAYPPDLTDATAKKIIEAWKPILNLEWL